MTDNGYQEAVARLEPQNGLEAAGLWSMVEFLVRGKMPQIRRRFGSVDKYVNWVEHEGMNNDLFHAMKFDNISVAVADHTTDVGLACDYQFLKICYGNRAGVPQVVHSGLSIIEQGASDYDPSVRFKSDNIMDSAGANPVSQTFGGYLRVPLMGHYKDFARKHPNFNISLALCHRLPMKHPMHTSVQNK